VVAGAGLFGLAVAATVIALLLLSVVGAIAQRVGAKDGEDDAAKGGR
jgi:uncharacterized membrane protein YhiD involved in acid resistance